MSANKSAADLRAVHRDISGNLLVAAATDDATLVTCRNANSTIYIQRIAFYVTTDAAQSMVFEDSNASAKKIAEIPSSPGDESPWIFDFGDNGVPLTEGKNFVMNVSAAGLAGHLEWDGYTRITSAVAAGSTN